MKFYVKESNEFHRTDYEIKSFILSHSSWDDYGHKTTYSLDFIKEDGRRISIGSVKILDKENLTTILDKEFETLDENRYCSLGAELNYYNGINLYDNLFDKYKLLSSLNDVGYYQALVEKFENVSGFSHSLLREREDKNTFILAKKIIDRFPFDKNPKFTFHTKLGIKANNISVEFNFDDSHNFSKRIYAIIGKNGSGKSRLLSNLSNALCLDQRIEENKLPESELGFFDTSNGPPLTKIIILSYSLFDSFRKPKPDKRYSYVYCGIRNENNEINIQHLNERILNSITTLNEDSQKFNFWFDCVSNFINLKEIGIVRDVFMYKIEGVDSINLNNFSVLSSGQTILFYAITELISHIREGSLILFDEPELYLHPNAIAKLINVLNNILEKYGSFLITSTHSPLLIQNLTSSNIIVLDREEEENIISKLPFEAFGESISEITRGVFETNEIHDGYKLDFKDLLKTNSYEEILAIFNNELSFHAKLILKSLNKNEKPQTNN